MTIGWPAALTSDRTEMEMFIEVTKMINHGGQTEFDLF